MLALVHKNLTTCSCHVGCQSTTRRRTTYAVHSYCHEIYARISL